MLGVARIPPQLCVRCRGSRYLCGLPYCPIIVNSISFKVLDRVEGERLDGSSPPSVFVGREGYPWVRVYPSSPPIKGDTSIHEDPSRWVLMDLEEFLSLRISLVRGYRVYRVGDAMQPSRELGEIIELSLSPGPADVEMLFERKPKGGVLVSETTPPMGPSAPLKRVNISSIKPLERVVEKVYNDRDLTAREGVFMLYSGGVEVHRISRILSVGAIGKKRRLVPTRWAITAVDKIVSDRLLEQVKSYSIIDRYMLYKRKVDRNLFISILAPHAWAFEWGEAWYPGSTWNMWGSEPWVEVDYEGYRGRDSYPGIGGCYYASRLASLEALNAMRRQAAVVSWREIYEGFNLPVGVWFVRENMRAMYRSEPEVFDRLEDVIKRIAELLRTPIRSFLERSGVFRILRSKRITSYMG
ncbi:MAG: Nre family DNA repair protein [Sulfolobales archaeon]